jgi:hypothetical protein
VLHVSRTRVYDSDFTFSHNIGTGAGKGKGTRIIANNASDAGRQSISHTVFEFRGTTVLND